MGTETGDMWVFGYGSLMWRPGFDYSERRKAVLPGYVRRFCLDSITYRGTPERPGLVLALDEARGARCAGLAYRVPAAERAATYAYIRDRELVTYSYLERWLSIELDDGSRAEALAYVMDRSHPQYRGELPLDRQAEVIAAAHGQAGSNVEYLERTAAQLRALGIEDPELFAVDALVAEVRLRSGP